MSAERATSRLEKWLAVPSVSQCAGRSFWLTMGLVAASAADAGHRTDPIGHWWEVPLVFALTWAFTFGLFAAFSKLNQWSDRRLKALSVTADENQEDRKP